MYVPSFGLPQNNGVEISNLENTRGNAGAVRELKNKDLSRESCSQSHSHQGLSALAAAETGTGQSAGCAGHSTRLHGNGQYTTATKSL